MQFKLSVLTTVAIAALAAASPLEARTDCSTGSIQCCNTVEKASDPAAAGILALLGITVQDVTSQVGLNCSPITVIGVGSGSCSAQAVCCSDNSHGDLISIGCVPFTL